MDDYATHPEAIFAALADGFARAATEREAAELTLAVGPTAVRVHMIGGPVEDLIRQSFGHLIRATQPAAASIDLWIPREGDPHWLAGGLTPPESRWGRLVSARERLFFHDWRAASDSALDAAGRRIVGCIRDPNGLTLDELAKPLHRLIGGLITADGAAVAHAALVGEGGGAVVLTGPGGSGKSTTALACRLAGLDYLGDDYVALSLAGGVATGHSLYASSVIAPGRLDGRARSAGLAAATFPGEAKQLFRLAPDTVKRTARLAAILLPRIGTGPATVLTPARPSDLLFAAGPHSLIGNAQDRGATLDLLARVAERVPVWHMALGPDLDEVVATVRAMLAIEPVA